MKTTTRITTALSFAALVASAMPAMAFTTPAERGNSNRPIRRAEWRGDLSRFDALDRNHDGVLTQDEMQQARGKHGKTNKQERFRGMDRNGDGIITRDEWRGNDESFRNHDLNRDGVLSGDELRGKGHDESSENRDDDVRSNDTEGHDKGHDKEHAKGHDKGHDKGHGKNRD